MNLLTFVLSLLLIFSFSTFAILEKQSGGRRLRATYLGHIAANRKILAKCEQENFQSIPISHKFGEDKQSSTPKQKSIQEPQEQKIPKVNPECARLNLWHLVQEGRDMHPFLYETALKLIKTFYGKDLFNNNLSEETRFLNIFLKNTKEALQKEPLFCLEKLFLGSSLQMTYYRMLKGTKEWDPFSHSGYPSLLDVIKIEETPSKVCLHHAHPKQLSVFFGSKAATKLYLEIHKPDTHITKEQIEQICSECHVMILDPSLFDLLEISPFRHPKTKKTTWIAEDSESKISLRKTIYRS